MSMSHVRLSEEEELSVQYRDDKHKGKMEASVEMRHFDTGEDEGNNNHTEIYLNDKEGEKGGGEGGHEKEGEQPLDRTIKGRAIAMKDMIWGNKMNLLLICLPFGFMAEYLNWGDSFVFVFCMLTMIPLAFLLGSATEELAKYTNQTIGGLLNATFGNATEVIISIFALKANLLRVVQASLLGSILSNLLLVLGCAFLFGGAKFHTQKFNRTAGLTSSSLLMLAMLGILSPAAFIYSQDGISPNPTDPHMLSVSRYTALFLFAMYGCFILFQLRTHKSLYEEQDEDEPPALLWWDAIGLLAVTTVLVSVFSEYLVDSIERVSISWGISETFIGIVLLPIVGNAAEHVTAVTVAMKNKMELSIGVAVGSATQISLLVIPFLVLLGWMMGKELSLYFHAFESVTVFVTVIIVHIILSDGESNWLEGAMLLAAYCIICIGFYFL